MLYLWKASNLLNKFMAIYDENRSPHRFFYREGIKLDAEEVSCCYAYMRSSLVVFDDPFIRTQLRPQRRYAYIFTANEMFCCAGGDALKIDIKTEELNRLKKELLLTEADIDSTPNVLSDKDLEIIFSAVAYPQFSRIPVLELSATTAIVEKKFDCIDNTAFLPIVNQKVADILLKFAPNDIQLFDVDIQCKDGRLTGYKLINITRTIKGIDREKSIYTTIDDSDSILMFKYLTYHPGCMGPYHLARDEEYLDNILISTELKQAFEHAKIKGAQFARPEDWYRPMRPEDLID